MKNIDQLKKDLKRLATDNFGVVLQKLDKVLNDDSTDYFNQFLMLFADFNRWRTDNLSGAQSYETVNQRFANLHSRLLNFIDMLSEKDVKASFHLKDEIHERILVVCKTPERVKYMGGFFPNEYFVNLKYSEPGEKSSAEKFDIVLFDNSPHDSDEGKHELLKHYLDDAKPVVLYFGAFLPVLNNYPEKAYATNSVFSLHARIGEMVEFLNYKRAVNPQ